MSLTPDAGADHVEGELDYVLPDSKVNRRFVAPGAEFSTGRFAPTTVPIFDGRPFRDRLTLDGVGFTLADHTSAVGDFFDADEVQRVYRPEVVETVQRLTGATRVVPMSWMARTSGDKELLARQTVGYGKAIGGVQPPAADVHVDMTPPRAHALARMMYDKWFPDGPGYSRFIASSLWHTFSDPPQDWPLAVCDGTSIDVSKGVANTMVIVDALPDEAAMYGPLAGEDQMPAALIFPYSPDHRWWYFSNMTRDECILLKFHDSDHSRAWLAPHTAFRDVSRPHATTRRSIEFRTFAYFE
jgi:hypothetical protein